MNAQQIVGTMALILQVAAAAYALWLNRISATRRATWAMGLAFLVLAVMHAAGASQFGLANSAAELAIQSAYIVTSLLLLAGLKRFGSVLRENQKTTGHGGKISDELESKVEERTAELVQANMKLARENQQRQQLEAEIRASHEVYRGLVDTIKGILFECRRSDLGFTFVSPQSELLLGYTPEVWLRTLTWRDIIHPEDFERFSEIWSGATSDGTKSSRPIEYRVRTRDGQIKWVSQFLNLSTEKTVDDKIRGLLVDVTDRKQFEDEVKQSQKLEAVGRLAGGVAHDFNNCLTVIQGYSQLVLSSNRLAGDSVDHVKRISQASDQAARLTQQLLAFSRKQEMKTQPVNLNTVIEDISKMLRAMVGDGVSFNLNLAEELPPIEADAGQLGQVLVNLVVNSRDAMPTGGRLVIQTEVVTFGEAAPQNDPDVRAGTFVSLSISDSGMGIPSSVQPQIFEPYSIGNGSGKGSGMGLSTVYGIVKQHQGWIRMSSEANQGTTFRLFFPAASDRKRVEPARIKEAVDESNHETILLVDDEPAVLDLVRSILQSHGYQVLSARSGLAALKLWNDHEKKVDLLLTDLVMPDGLSGLDLLGHLREDRPDLKAILMSGYASPDLSLSHRTAFLQKPYRPSALLKTIHDCLLDNADSATVLSN